VLSWKIAAVTDQSLFIGARFPAPTAGRIVRDGDGFRFEV
jgi:hypothetical protein